MNKVEIRKKARELMMPQCRMCKECDGVACRGEVPGMGGKGKGLGFIRNVDALNKYTLETRTIHSAKNPDLSFNFFGHHLSMPVMPAPTTGVSINMGGKVTEETYIRALIKGSRASGIIPMVGDSLYPSVLQDNLRVLKEEEVTGIPFIKPWNQDELKKRIDWSMEVSSLAIGVDIDSAGLDTLKMGEQRVDPKTLEELKEISIYLKVPFIIKGIMTSSEANLAILAGADAIVVSNHGGRVLDSVPATCEVLPSIANTVGGRIPILVDGGVRSGVDVFKMLALGADCVLIGRPFAQYAIGGGEEGVKLYADQIFNELKGAMTLTGCQTLKEIREPNKLSEIGVSSF